MHSLNAKRCAALVVGLSSMLMLVPSSADAAFTTTPKVWEGLTWEPDNSGAPQTSSELNGTAPNDTISPVMGRRLRVTGGDGARTSGWHARS